MNCVSHNKDLTMHEGGTLDLEYRWSVDSVVQDLHDCTGLMQIRKKMSDAEPLLDIPFITDAWVADGETGIYIKDDGATPELKGWYRIYVNDVDSMGLCSAYKDIEGVYTLFLYSADGESILKMYGVMNIEASAARV